MARRLLGGERFVLPFHDGGLDGLDDRSWLAQAPRSHHPSMHKLPEEHQLLERRRPGQHLLKKQSFQAPCSRDELQLCVTLEKPEEAKRLLPQVRSLDSGMHGMQMLLLEQFIEKDYDDDLLLLTAAEQPGGRLVGLIFWRYLRSKDDDFWQHVLFDWGKVSIEDPSCRSLPSSSSRAEALQASSCPPVPPPEAWVLVELLCTESAYRGHGIGKLLLVAALAYSTVKDGKAAAVLTLGHGDDNPAAADLYRKLGFQQMPQELVGEPKEPEDPSMPPERYVDPRHVLVLWDIQRGLGALTLGEVSGSSKGTRVPQLEGGAEAIESEEHLDSEACAEVVERLTGP